jgi:hypothetical protein
LCVRQDAVCNIPGQRFIVICEATISFVISLLPHGTNRLPEEKFSLSVKLKLFQNSFPENSVTLQSYNNNVYFHKHCGYLLKYSADISSKLKKCQKNLVKKICTDI